MGPSTAPEESYSPKTEGGFLTSPPALSGWNVFNVLDISSGFWASGSPRIGDPMFF